MNITRHKNGEIEIDGNLEEVNTKEELLAVLAKIGANLHKPDYSTGDAKTYANIGLQNGYAEIKIEDVERYMDKGI